MLEITEKYTFIGLRSSNGALYLDKVEIEWDGGSAEFSVTFDKANWFEVEQGTASSVTAIARNGAEPYTYEWSCDQSELLTGTEATLAIPETLEAGDYSLFCNVTDADLNAINAGIGLRVVEPKAKFPVTVAEGIVNGTVTVDKAEAIEGETVTVTATPAEGYGLEAITVNGTAISGKTFPMPGEAAVVSATFVEVKDFATLPFVAEDTPYSGPWKTATVSGLTSKGLGNDYTSGGAVGARLDDTGDWLQIKFQGTAGELSYGIKGNSLSEEKPSTFKVQESADGETWSDLATFTTGDNLTGSTVGYTNEVSASSQFVRFFYDTKGAGNIGIYDVYITSGGPAVFSIALDPASFFEVEVGEEASIAATPKNAEGDVHYAWTVGGVSAGSDSAVLGLDTSAATEELEVVCTATDGADTVATASVSYKVVAPAPKFTVTVDSDIANGSITASPLEAAEGETIALSATPDAGWKLGTYLLDGETLTGDSFAMPAHDVLVSATFVEKPAVSGDELTNADVGHQTSSYKDWTAEKDSGAVYAGQSAGGSATNPCIQLRSNNNNSGIVMTKDSGRNVSSVSIEWNAQSGADRVVEVYGSTTAYSAPSDLYGDAKGTLLGAITNGAAETSVDVAAVGEFPFVGIRSKSGALYLTSVTVAFESGPATFAVALSPSKYFEVEVGAEASITATPRNASGDVTYAWSIGGTPVDATGAVLALDTGAATEELEVVCTATDGSGAEATASVSYKVVVPAEKFPVTIAEGIVNGEVTVDKTEAEAGETVTVTATPAEGYGLEAITVNGTAITGTTFQMPAEPAVVGATFHEVKDYAELPFVAEDTPYSGPWKGATVDGMTSKGLGNDYADGSAKLDGKGDYVQIKFVGTPGTLSYGIKGNSVSADNPSTFLVQESADGENWETLATYVSGDNLGDKVEASHELSATSQFVRFFYETKGAGNVGIYDVYISAGGPAVFSVKLDPASDFSVEQGAAASIKATPKNAEGDVSYVWKIDGTPVDAIGDELILDTSVVGGPHEATCDATDGSGATATASVSYTVTEPGPQPGEPALVFGGDSTGTVGTPVTFTVAAVNVSDPTVYFDGFEFPTDSTLTDDDITKDFPTVTFTPDVAGDYVFNFSAGEGDDFVEGSWTVTVTGEGPGPQPTEGKITKMTIASGKMTIEFTGEGAQVLLSDDLQTWTPVDGAISPFEFNMNEAGKKYIGVR